MLEDKPLLHYCIVAKLGSGGMGTVYRATDTKLGRDVALKMLPADAAARPESMERFRREARAVAALNHSHIVTIHSVEEAVDPDDGGPLCFLTMELLEGRSLDELIPAEGMPVEEIFALALQLTDALAAAHEQGVVHRDLKPANLMVSTEGHLKVLDFGLAKLTRAGSAEADVSEAATEMATREGVIMGTVPYMSPEQLTGKSVDFRTDMFSTGAILYEMACGERPFQGDSTAELTSSILRDSPAPLQEGRADLPPALGAIIGRCLEKAPDDRFESARQLHDEIAAVQAGFVSGAVTGSRRPFVGREAERVAIRKMLDAALAGSGGLVLLGGEPGVGKTRLAEEVLREATARGMLALEGHAYEDEGAPYVTASEILEEMTRVLPQEKLRAMLGDNASEIARLMPALRRRFPDIPEPLDLPAEQQRRYLFNSVLEFLDRSTRELPMVMLLDDLHWADESSLLLLEHVALQLDRLPLLFVGTYRDVELDVGRPFAKMRADLVRRGLGQRILVRRFDEGDVATLLAALGGSEPPPTLVEAIFTETEGNPFFVTEVFQHLDEEGLLFDDQGEWLSDLDVEKLEVPEGARLVIGRRLERLAPATVKVLGSAAIIGLRFELGVLEEAAVGDPDEVLDAIEEAEAAQLIAPRPGRRAARYEFVHALVRQTLLDALSVPRRQRGHLRVAEAMEKAWGAAAGERAGEIAHHLYQSAAAADPEKTRRYLALAAQQSIEAAAFDEAVTLVDRALEDDDDCDAEELGRLLHLRGGAYQALGRWQMAAADGEKALTFLEEAGADEMFADACYELARLYLWANQTEAAVATGERGLQVVSREDRASHALMLATAGHASSNSGDYASAEKYNSEAIAIAEDLGDKQVISRSLIGRCYQGEHWRETHRQLETGERAIALARESGSDWDLSVAIGATTFAMMDQRGWQPTAALIAELMPLATRLGYAGGEIHAIYGDAFVKLARGDLEMARDALDHAIERSKELKMPWVSLMVAVAGQLACMRGRRGEAEALFDEAMQNALPTFTFAGIEAAVVMRSLARLRDEKVPSLMDELGPRLPRPGAKSGVGGWSVCAAATETTAIFGQPASAAALYPMWVQFIEDNRTVGLWGFGFGERLAGICAAAGARWDVATEHFDKALQQSDHLADHLERLETLAWHGWMLRQQGVAEAATELLTEAEDGFRKMGVDESWWAFVDSPATGM